MQNLKPRLVKLVKELFTSELNKQKLLLRIEKEGVSEEVLNDVRAIIEKAIEENEVKTEAEVEKLQTQLAESVKKVKAEYSDIEISAKQAKLAARKQADENELDKIRKQIAT